MSTYMNRCPRCGCTDETRIMRREYDEMQALCYKMLNFVAGIDLDNDPTTYQARVWLIADAANMGIAPAKKVEQNDD